MNPKISVALFLLVALVARSNAEIQTIECKDGNLFGVQELVESVEKTVEGCTNTTSTKAELFGCIFKGLDMFNEEKPAVEKVKGFFERVFSSKIMMAAKDLTERLTTCAQNYVKAFQEMKSMDDIGNAGEAFSSCFFEATKKFTYYIRKECKPMDGATESPAS